MEGDASKKIRRNRPRRYGPEVMKILIKLWAMLDYPANRRLVAALPGAIEALQRHGELALPSCLRTKLLSISPAAVDRLLQEEKKGAMPSKPKPRPDQPGYSVAKCRYKPLLRLSGASQGICR